MDCNQPLSDDQISAALDGSADEQTQQHLKDCPDCQSRLNDARHFESNLTSKLFRHDCPSANRLRDYAMAFMNTAQAAEMATHLEICARCRAELAEIQAFLSADEVILEAESPEVTETSAQIFAKLGDLILRPVRGQMVAAVRGEAQEPMRFETEGLTLFIEIEHKQDVYTVIGQIIATDQDRWGGALVECRQDNRVIATAFVKEVGIFSCDMPEARPFDLRIIPETGQSVFISNIQPGP